MERIRSFAWSLALLSSVQLDAQSEVMKLQEPRSASAPYHAHYGEAVSLSTGRMAVGMPHAAVGSVEIRERTAAEAWVAAATVAASDGELYDEFGTFVAIGLDTLVVCAPKHGDNPWGAVYVFERDPQGAWSETAKLDPPFQVSRFGRSVALDGDRFVVGARSGDEGRVYVYERQAGVWAQKTFVKSSLSDSGGDFGSSVDLDGDRLVVGARNSDTFTGRAFVFELEFLGWYWAEKAVLSPSDLDDYDYFGWSVAIRGDRVVVGARYHRTQTGAVGAAYVFERLGGVWSQTAKLHSAGPTITAGYGGAVGLAEDRILVGAYADSERAPSAGAVHVYEPGPAGWTETAKLHGSGIGPADTFGFALDASDSLLLIGAPNVYTSPSGSGSAFLYDLAPTGSSLLADVAQISLVQGGAQTLNLGAGPEHAGDVYLVAGSARGTSPGFVLGGFAIPLVPDAYFVHTTTHPGASPLQHGMGTLDANGFAQASFHLHPSTWPGVAGSVMHHAYAVLDPATLQLKAVSAALPLALVP